jgi:acyl-CoA thioesterase-1
MNYFFSYPSIHTLVVCSCLKRAICFFSCWCLFISSSFSQVVSKSVIKIACIGNSITAGARLQHPEMESYPAILSELLKGKGPSDYRVKNFGVGGATMLRFGQPNLWKLLDSVKNFHPDIVIIKAGTNETVAKPRYNWDHISDFEKDYTDYLTAIKKVNPRCKIIICSPTDMVLDTEGLSVERKADLGERRPRLWQLRKRIKKLAKANKVYYLDLTRAFKDKKSLMTNTDGVHPNQEGYRFLATLVYDFVVKKKIVIFE